MNMSKPIVLGFLLFFDGALRSDIVECDNGDRYNGKVLLVDEQNVKVQNEIAGILNIPRSKVAVITFGPAHAQKLGVLSAPSNSTALTLPSFDPASVQQVQDQFLSEANPEAKQMFQDMVRGLMSGKLNPSDIRGQAQSTLDELKQLQKELGDDDAAALLGSYASILENFVKQAPARTNTLPVPAPPVSAPRAEE